MTGTGNGRGLPDGWWRVAAVVARPDDESFGLGDHLALPSDSGVPTVVLCFTRGAASTLHGRPGDLRTVRADELACAARELGVDRVELTGHPDSALADVPVPCPGAEVTWLIGERHPPTCLCSTQGRHRTPGRSTGHECHPVRATRRAGVAVLVWTLPRRVTERLNTEFGMSFTGRAIACHASQSSDNPVLRRPLELLGDRECLRVLE